MTSADAARRVPWLRYALLGVIITAIFLAISLFSSAVGASAEEAEPVGPGSVAGGTSGTAPPAPVPEADTSMRAGQVVDAAAEPVAEPPVHPVAEPVAPVAEATVEELPVVEPATDAGSSMGAGAASPAADGKPLGTEQHAVGTPPDPAVAAPLTGETRAPRGLAESAEPPGLAGTPTNRTPAPPGRADERPAAPGLADKPDRRATPAPSPAPAPQNDTPHGLARTPTGDKPAPPGVADRPDHTGTLAPSSPPAPQNTASPGRADKPVGAPAVEHPALEPAPLALDTLGYLPAASVPPGPTDAPGAPGVPGPTASDARAPGSQVSGPPSDSQIFGYDDWSTPASSRIDTAIAPADPSGTITPADGTSPGGAAPGSPASSGGTGSGGAGSGGAGSGAAGASGTSDAALSAVVLDALASLVLHSVDDELPSSPVHDTDTTPD